MDVSVVSPDGSKIIVAIHPNDTLAKIKEKLVRYTIKFDNIVFADKPLSIYINRKRVRNQYKYGFNSIGKSLRSKIASLSS